MNDVSPFLLTAVPAQPSELEPRVSDLDSTDIDASLGAGEAAFAVLRLHFARFLELEPAVRAGDDIEAVHQTRVASRRLRVAIGLFSDFLKRAMEHQMGAGRVPPPARAVATETQAPRPPAAVEAEPVIEHADSA